MSDYGLLQEVVVAARGSVLAADAAVAATELLIDYAGDFDDEGGTVDLNGARLAFTGIVDGTLPEDPDTLLLAAPLAVAAEEDDQVAVVAGGQIATDYYAIVTMGDDGDHIRVPLRVDQRAQWPPGVYDDPVPVVVSDDLQHLEDAPGRTAPGRTAFLNTDSVAAEGPGDLTLTLSYTPISGSLQVWWGGIPQPPTEWSLSGTTVTIPDPDSRIRAGRVFTAYYAYDVIELGTAHVATTVEWGSTGPNFTVAEGDMTNYSASSFDDSAWTVDGPAGHPLGPNAAQPTWPDVVFDTGSTDAGVWLRREVTLPSPATLEISARVDGQWWLYCDGVLVSSEGTGTPSVAEKGPFAVAVTAGAHVIALHVNDDSADPGSDYLYADLNAAVV